MRRLIVTMIALGFVSCVVHKKSGKGEGDTTNCQRDWHYFIQQDTLQGVVIMQQKVGALCGIFAFASNTIIKLTSGDTIRVLELCNMNEYKAGTIVTLIPEKKPSFGVSILSTSFDCVIKRTCYGRVVNAKL